MIDSSKTLIIDKSRSEPFERTQYDIWAGFGQVGSTENFALGYDAF